MAKCQGLAPPLPRVGPVLQYLREWPIPHGDYNQLIKTSSSLKGLRVSCFHVCVCFSGNVTRTCHFFYVLVQKTIRFVLSCLEAHMAKGPFVICLAVCPHVHLWSVQRYLFQVIHMKYVNIHMSWRNYRQVDLWTIETLNIGRNMTDTPPPRSPHCSFVLIFPACLLANKTICTLMSISFILWCQYDTALLAALHNHTRSQLSPGETETDTNPFAARPWNRREMVWTTRSCGKTLFPTRLVVNIVIRTLVHFTIYTWFYRLRPYHVENTGSRPITEVKQRRAWLVLGWVTAWEYQVP